MTSTERDSIARFQAAFASGDRDLLATLVDPEFEVHQSSNLPYGGRYRGIEGFFEFALGLFLTTWNIETFEMLRRFDEKGTEPGIESVVIQIRLAGTVAATGEAFDTTLLEHWIMRNGKLLFAQPHWFETPAKP